MRISQIRARPKIRMLPNRQRPAPSLLSMLRPLHRINVISWERKSKRADCANAARKIFIVIVLSASIGEINMAGHVRSHTLSSEAYPVRSGSALTALPLTNTVGCLSSLCL